MRQAGRAHVHVGVCPPGGEGADVGAVHPVVDGALLVHAQVVVAQGGRGAEVELDLRMRQKAAARDDLAGRSTLGPDSSQHDSIIVA
jgi:hypothetical protein